MVFPQLLFARAGEDAPFPVSRSTPSQIVILAVLCAAPAPLFAWLVRSGPVPVIGMVLTAAAAVAAMAGGVRAGALAALLLAGADTGWKFAHHSRWNAPDFLTLAVILLAAAVLGYWSDRAFRAEVQSNLLSVDLSNLRSEIATERADLVHFHDFSLRLLRCLDPNALLNEVLEAVIGIQEAPGGAFLLVSSASTEALEVAAQFGLDAEQVRELRALLPSNAFPLRRREIVEDAHAPRMLSALISVRGVSAMASVPIITAAGTPLGVVVTFFANPHRPHEREIRLTELYLAQAANAIENARLYRRSLETVQLEQRRASLLRRVNAASIEVHSAVSLDAVLQTVTEKAREVIGAHQAFTTFAPHGNWTRSITCVSVSPEFAETQPGAGSDADSLLFAYATNGAAGLLDAKSPRDARIIGLASRVLVAPLTTSDGHNVGAIRVANKIGGAFNEDDRSILVQLAHVASVAVENVRLLRKAQEQIGERERAQEALERSKQSLQIAQRAAGIGVWEWDLQLGELSWSAEIATLHGIEPGAFDGRYETWLQTIEPEDRDAVHRAVASAVSTGTDLEVQYRLREVPDETTRWMEIRGQVFASSGTPIRMSGIAMDITSRKLSEEALRTSEKLAATGRLAATIAHEVNNPLAAVTNLLYLLRAHPELDEEARQYVQTAEAELSRVTHITRQTLGFYRESARPVDTDPLKLVDEVLAIYSRQIEQRGINVRREYRFDGTIVAFPGELRQVIANLVCNAVEALPDHGTLRIHVYRQWARLQHPAGVRIVIADNGVGIPLENRRHIFEPFFTTKGERGTGLGLWVTRGIVEKHGGTIRLRSSTHQAAHGTCFSIFLPLEFFPPHHGPMPVPGEAAAYSQPAC